MPNSTDFPHPSPHAFAENRLLAALSPDDHARVVARCAVRSIDSHDVLYHAGGPIEHVYFPRSGAMSAVKLMGDGRAAEVAAVGIEGMIGVSAFLGAEASSVRVFCQIPGEVLRIPTAPFLGEVRRDGQLQAILHRYLRYTLDSSAQMIACNVLHPIEERCARWLLMSADRAGSDEFPMTHEFLALMLGVRRPSVTLAAGALQSSGLISYRHGHITVLDRGRLEEASCECYRTMCDEYGALFP